MERAVKLIGLNHHIVALVREQQIGAIVLRDTSKEGRRPHMRTIDEMGRHGRRGGLAVRTRHTQASATAGDGT